MAQEQLTAARDLIKAKRYQEARQVLKVIADHPTARVWLAKLDEIAPEVPEDDPFAVFDAPAARPAPVAPTPKPKAKRRLDRRVALVLFIVLILIGIGAYVYFDTSMRASSDAMRDVVATVNSRFDATRTAIYRK